MLKFRRLPARYAIVRLDPRAPIPDWSTKGEFTSATRTTDELSIVCPAEDIPEKGTPALRWRCLKLDAPFPFSQPGVLLSFTEPLSKNGIPVFAISTYDTDYILIPEEHSSRAADLLREAGYELLSG